MPGLTVFVLAGGDDRMAAATLRSARSFFKGVDLEEVNRSIHSSLSPATPGTVSRTATLDEVWSEACSSASSEWILLLQPGDRLTGDLESVLGAMNDPSAHGIELVMEEPSLLPNPTIWPPVRLVRPSAWAPGEWSGASVRCPAMIRTGNPMSDPLYRNWALAATERKGSTIDLACALHHAGFHDAALVRMLDVVRSSTDSHTRTPASRYATMMAVAARRPEAGRRPAQEWLSDSGRSQGSLAWWAIVEVGRDHPAGAWHALREATTQRHDDQSGMDPTVIESLSKSFEGMIAARQTEALKYRRVLRTTTGEQRHRAARSLVHAWVASGMDPADLFGDLDPEALAAMEDAIGEMTAFDVDIWLATAEAFAEHATLTDRLAERITIAASIQGVTAATTWSKRLRSLGLARFCPLLEMAKSTSDPVDRTVAAAIVRYEIGDPGAAPLLDSAAKAVPLRRLPHMLAAVKARVPAAVEAAMGAAATTPKRRAMLSREP